MLTRDAARGRRPVVLIGATSLVVLSTGVFPRWLGWVGVVVALLELASWRSFGRTALRAVDDAIELAGEVERGRRPVGVERVVAADSLAGGQPSTSMPRSRSCSSASGSG